MDQLDVERDWLYSKVTGGLTWVGAAVIAVVSAWSVDAQGAQGRGDPRGRSRARGERRERDERRCAGAVTPLMIVAMLAGLFVLAAAPFVLGSVIAEVLGTVMVFALLGLGLNIVVGYAGLLDLGYVFFFTLGAYSLALLTGATLNTFVGSSEPAVVFDLNFYVAIPIVIMIAAAAGVLDRRAGAAAARRLPRARHPGLGEMIVVLVTSPWLEPLVGGPQGMRDITNAAIGDFGFRDPKHFYFLALAFVALALFVSWRLANSRIGRAWTALREDEQVADAMGVSTTSYKLLAFAIGGAIGSVGGALFAVKIGSLTPASFQVLVSIQVLGIVILGGIGSLPGVIVGSLVLVGLPGLLREFEEYRLLAYGAALVAVMLLRPQGLIPNVRRSRELREEDREQDKWAGDDSRRRTCGDGPQPPRGGRRMSPALLEVEGVTKRFGGLSALNDLSFEVDEGEIVSVIGPNGAGKSTVFNVITGLYPPDEGDVRLRGQSIVGLSPNRITKAGIARTFQNVHLFPNMTRARERDGGPALPQQGGHLRIDRAHPARAARGRDDPRARQGEPRRSSARASPATVRTSRRSRSPTPTGGGSRWRRALATDPALMLLDEPTAGMNPRETLELRDHIVRMRDELGLTVLVIEHDMRVVKGVSDRVVACDYGRKIAEGTYEEVANDEQVVEAYLGVRHEELG